ncbi:MAG: TonB-dependent receptor [Pseudoxanthomonas sp.]
MSLLSSGRLSAAVACALFAQPAGFAFAGAMPDAGIQENAGFAPEQDQAPKKATELDTVTVTAERRVQDVQKTAIAISVESGEELLRKGVTTIDAALREAPGVEIQSRPQGGQIYIRGVGSNGDSNYIDSAVSVMRDNVYSGTAEAVMAAMYDVDRVEVLRGPQGTLYGRNATGGTVNVITNAPVDEFESALNLQAGGYGLAHADAAVNLPVSDALALRFAGMREVRDGYYSNGGGDSNVYGARFKALYKPSERFSLLASVDYLHLKNLGVTTVPRAFTIPTDPEGNIPPPLVWLQWRTDYDDPWDVDPEHPAQWQEYAFTTASLQTDWDLGWGVLTVLPAYSRSDRHVFTDLVSGIADDDLDGEPDSLPEDRWREKQYTLEARLASPQQSPVKWVVGAYYLHSENVSLLADSQTDPALSLTDYIDFGGVQPTTSKAVFGQLTWPLGDALRGTLGLRYTRDHKAWLTDYQSIIGSWDPGPQTYTADANALTYKAGIEYDLGASAMLYAQVASGYKSGGFSTTASPPKSYDPEYLTAFELGVKSRLLDNRLQINAETFLYRYEDYQVQYQAFGVENINPDALEDDDPSNDTLFQQFVANAGEGKIYGGELDTRYRFTDNDELRLALTYTHARYGKIDEPQIAYASYARVANTPEWTARLGYSHDWVLGNGGLLSANVSVRWSDEYDATMQTDLPGNPDIHQDSFTRSDASLSYVPGAGGWSMTAWVRNIEDKAQIVGLLPWGRALITDPRTWGVNLNLKF